MKVTLRAANPHDTLEVDLLELSQFIKEQDDTLELGIESRPERGYGVTLPEVIHVILESSDEVNQARTIMSVVKATVQWAQKRRQQDRDVRPNEEPRPRLVTIFGPDGEELKLVTVDTDEG